MGQGSPTLNILVISAIVGDNIRIDVRHADLKVATRFTPQDVLVAGLFERGNGGILDNVSE
jgi:hypothetical protein